MSDFRVLGYVRKHPCRPRFTEAWQLNQIRDYANAQNSVIEKIYTDFDTPALRTGRWTRDSSLEAQPQLHRMLQDIISTDKRSRGYNLVIVVAKLEILARDSNTYREIKKVLDIDDRQRHIGSANLYIVDIDQNIHDWPTRTLMIGVTLACIEYFDQEQALDADFLSQQTLSHPTTGISPDLFQTPGRSILTGATLLGSTEDRTALSSDDNPTPNSEIGASSPRVPRMRPPIVKLPSSRE